MPEIIFCLTEKRGCRYVTESHNAQHISVDGSTKDFEFDIGLRYQIAARFEADVRLIGSTTAKTVLTDTGGTLGNILLENRLVDEISLLISSVLVGKKSTNLFRNLGSNIKLELTENKVLDKNYLWLVYKVLE